MLKNLQSKISKNQVYPEKIFTFHAEGEIIYNEIHKYILKVKDKYVLLHTHYLYTYFVYNRYIFYLYVCQCTYIHKNIFHIILLFLLNFIVNIFSHNNINLNIYLEAIQKNLNQQVPKIFMKIFQLLLIVHYTYLYDVCVAHE